MSARRRPRLPGPLLSLRLIETAAGGAGHFRITLQCWENGDRLAKYKGGRAAGTVPLYSKVMTVAFSIKQQFNQVNANLLQQPLATY
jgi:hypothetical protein